MNSADRVPGRARRGRLLAALAVAGAVQACPAPATGESLPPEDAGEPARRRVEVVLGVAGPLDEEVRRELRSLLQAELRAEGLELVERDPTGALSSWTEQVSGERTLLAVLLDVRRRAGWRLVVIDTARSRAIARELTGGMEQNAASIEAVVSIVLSATSALGEGLEVASSSVDQVVGEPTPVREQRPPVRKAPRAKVERPKLEPSKTAALRARAGVGAASFSSEVPATWGPGVSLGLGLGGVELQAGAGYHLPVTIPSAFGRFQIDRVLAALSAGPRLLEGTFTLVPEAGVCVEWLGRSETSPAAGVSARDARTVQRWGGLLSLRSRYRLVPPVSIELATGASYFGRAVQFVARDPNSVRLTDVAPVVFHGQLALEIAVD